MKSVWISTTLALGLLFGGAIVLLLSSNRPGAEAIDPELVNRLAREVSTLKGELARLDELQRSLRAELQARMARGGGAPEVPPDPTSAPTVPDEGDASLADATPEDGGSPSLRSYIVTVLEEERAAREERQRAEARRRSEEWSELQKGPYGQFNYKVNSLVRKLGLDDRQAQQYHHLLVDYQKRFRELRKGVRWGDADSRKAHQEKRRLLQLEFDNAVSWGLGPEQKAAYQELPEGTRSPEGGAFVYQDLPGGAGVTTFVLGGDEGGEALNAEIQIAPFAVSGDVTISPEGSTSAEASE